MLLYHYRSSNYFPTRFSLQGRWQKQPFFSSVASHMSRHRLYICKHHKKDGLSTFSTWPSRHNGCGTFLDLTQNWCHWNQIERYIERLTFFPHATGERWISCLVWMIETRVSYRTWINYQTMSDLSGETNLANLSRIIRINYSVRRLWRMCVLFAFDPKHQWTKAKFHPRR